MRTVKYVKMTSYTATTICVYFMVDLLQSPNTYTVIFATLVTLLYIHCLGAELIEAMFGLIGSHQSNHH